MFIAERGKEGFADFQTRRIPACDAPTLTSTSLLLFLPTMHTQSPPPQNARRFLLRGLVAGLLLTQSALTAFAQTAVPTKEEEEKAKKDAEKVVVLDAFVVTAGFAGSLAAAAEIKQNQKLITEILAAEDIGKLPDVSIAESLARLPGLTTQRINSRSQAIVIRGLTGDFSTGLLNGREQVTTGSNRAVEFDQYPAELLSGVTVYKTADAALVGQGLAGTIDLRTVRPLSHGRRSVVTNVTYEWVELGKLNPDSKDAGMRYTLSYIDQFADGKVGIALGYAKADRPGQGEQFNAWGYPDAYYNPALPRVIGGVKPFVRSSQLEREGWMGVIEFKPSESLHSTIDLYYSDFNETQRLRGIEIPLQWSSAQLQPGYTAERGLVTRGVFTNVFGVVRNDIVLRDAEVFAAGWNLRFGDGEGWTTEADLSHSRVKRKDTVLETYSGFGSDQVGTPDTMAFSMTGLGILFRPTLDYTNRSLLTLAGPQGWGGHVVPGGQVGFLKGPRTEDELSQFKVLAKRELDGFFSSFEAGLAYTERAKWEIEMGPRGEEGFFLGLASGARRAPLPPSVGITNLSFIGIPGMASYDPLAALNSGLYRLTPNQNPDYVSENWDVEEKVTLGYLQFGIDKKLGAIPVTGSLGTQIISSDQSSTGLAARGTTITPITGSHDYIDFVPSLNLNFELADRKILRLSVARQLARQPMRDMRAGATIGFDERLKDSTDPLNSPWSGWGGNPKLEPWRANAVDLSYEHYFKDSMGYWALAGFHKDLRSYTYDERVLADFTGLPTGIPGVTPRIFQGYRWMKQNGQGGNIRGVEFTLSLPGEKVSQVLSGFGLIVGGAYVKSSIQPDLGNPAVPLPGLSEKVLSSTLYYEKGGFATRVSSRYRSDYRGDIATFGPRGAQFRNLQAETVIDAQVSYAFKKGRLKGLSVIAQGYNVTDEPLFASEGLDTRLVKDYQRYGASYSVGMSYKF